MNRVKDKRLWISIVGITGLGLLSGLFSVNAREYYQALRLPSFAPPGWLFGPVWLVLYIFMGITFYFIEVKLGDIRLDNGIQVISRLL